MQRGVRVSWFLMATLLFACGGCGGRDPSLPPLVPVEGTVTLNGTPLADANVQFHPMGNTLGRGAAAVTNAEGRYSLIAPDGSDGAPVGEYRVVIGKLVMPDGSLFTPTDDVAPMDSPARELLPEYYSMFERSTLTATVPEGGGSVDFQLTSRR